MRYIVVLVFGLHFYRSSSYRKNIWPTDIDAKTMHFPIWHTVVARKYPLILSDPFAKSFWNSSTAYVLLNHSGPPR